MNTTTRDGSRSETWSDIGLVAIVVVPIVVAVIRAIVTHYTPMTDDALLTIRSHDVFSTNIPLLGSGSSASIAVTEPVSNTGPLQFYAAAIPVRVFGSGPGAAIAAGSLNAACIVGAMWSARRTAGRTGLVAVGLAAAVLAHAMGSELLYDLWQPHAMLLPGVALVVFVWAVASGRPRALPWVVVLGSLVAQAHLSYVFVGAAAVAGSFALVAVDAWRRHGRHRSEAWRSMAIGAATLVMCWLAPMVEQFFGRGPGNLSRLAGDIGSRPTVGFAGASRILATNVVRHPWLTRDGFENSIPNIFANPAGDGDFGPLSSPMASAVVAVAIVAVFGMIVALAVTRADRVGIAAGACGLALLALSVWTVRSLPYGAFGVSPHHVRFLSGSLTALLALVLAGVFRLVQPAFRLPRAPTRRGATAAASIVLAAVSIPTIPTFVQPIGPVNDADAAPTARRLVAQLGPLEGRGQLLFDARFYFFGEVYFSSVLLNLVERGVDIRSNQPLDIRQLGEGRRDDGQSVGLVIVGQGDDAVAPLEGAQRVAFVAGLTDAEHDELLTLRDIVEAERSDAQTARLVELEAAFERHTVAVFYAPITAAD